MRYRLTEDDLDKLPPNIASQVKVVLDYGDQVDDHVPVNCAPERKAPKKPYRRSSGSEEQVGRDLTTWIDLVVLPSGCRPGLLWHHIPNGMASSAVQGGIMKAQGLRKGWPDYGLMLPAGPYHGMYQEIKSEEGAKPGKEQLDHLARLESLGYKVYVAWGFDQAKGQILEYLDIYNRSTAAGR